MEHGDDFISIILQTEGSRPLLFLAKFGTRSQQGGGSDQIPSFFWDLAKAQNH